MALNEFEKSGRVWLRTALGKSDIARLRSDLKTQSHRIPVSKIDPVVQEKINSNLTNILPNPFPVRALLFSKSKEQSWSSGWHQDRIIAVRDKIDVSGFKNWTRKDNVWHCEPPVSILERMIFVQIYLDDVLETSGPMQIAIASHKQGKLTGVETSKVANASDLEICTARAGDILICKALLVHRSRSMEVRRPRNIIRMDFANFKLPLPLGWVR